MRAPAEARLHCFGYPCHLVLSHPDGDADELMQIALGELARLEGKFSSFDSESIVGRINAMDENAQAIPLDDEAQSLFNYVTTLWENTGGAFDPTVSLLQACYDESYSAGKTASCVRSKLPKVGWAKMEIGPGTARLGTPGMYIDLNSIVRPYVVDRVRKLLRKAGAASALIDLDRDIATVGKQTDGSNWMHRLRHPRGSRTAIARLKLNDGAFAIRGDFERSLDYDGERFGRALNPADGRPIDGLVSVAVAADTCLEACTVATVARMKAATDAVAWLEEQPHRWMAIDRDMHCHGPLTPNTAI